jgi:hypothetical protein
MDDLDHELLELPGRIAERLPELDLDQRSVDWMKLDDGHEALLVDGGGIDGGKAAYFANHGDDLHAYGSLAPILASSSVAS